MSERSSSVDPKHERYFYVYLTENLDVGHETRHTPQHITLIPPFISDRQKVIDIAKKVASSFSPFTVSLDGYYDFGFNKSIPAILIKPNEKLNQLHMGLVNELRNEGIDIYDIYRNQFVDDKFMPHITLKKLHPKVDSTKPILIDHIAAIYKYKDTKTVIAKFKLGDKQ